MLEVYPRRVPPDWKTFRASQENLPQLPEEDLYLVASDIGPAIVDKVKRGPDKGFWRIDEVRSPVIFMERSPARTRRASCSAASCGPSWT